MGGYLILLKLPSTSLIGTKILESRIDSKYYSNIYLDIFEKINKFDTYKLQRLTKKIYRDPMCYGFNYVSSNDSTKYFRGEDLDDLINYDEVANIPKDCYDKYPNAQVKYGDIFFSVRGAIGKVGILTKNIKGLISPNLIVIRPDTDKIDEFYLYAYLASNIGKQIISRYKMQTIQETILASDIKRIPVVKPDKEIQKYIGDKVRRAEELREEARRLKKIAEDIVKNELRLDELKMKLENVKDTFGWRGPQVLTARIDSSYYNQKYLLKEEFLRNCQDKFVMLNELVEVVFTGKKPSKVDTGEEIFFIQSGDISTNFMELNTKVKVDINKSRLVEYGDLLFAKDGETIGKIAVNYSTKKSILNEHTYCIRLKKKYKSYTSYIYYLLINDLFNDLIRREATGSAQKGINQDFLERIVIPIISEKKILQLKELEEDRCKKIYQSKELIQQAKQDVEDLIEGKFDMSKLKESAVESR